MNRREENYQKQAVEELMLEKVVMDVEETEKAGAGTAVVNGFEKFNLGEKLLMSLKEMEFLSPTPIQEKAIPFALSGLDVIGQAQTGTGKTGAFAIPILQKMPNIPPKKFRPNAIIMVPTRELAVQVKNEIFKMGKFGKNKVMAIYGGEPIDKQINLLQKGMQIVVGTPGRLLDHMNRRTLVLDNILMAVLDEADEMLDMGFINDIKAILEKCPKERQTMLFSATFPYEILELSNQFMKSPEVIHVSPNIPVTSKIKQYFYRVKDYDRAKALISLLKTSKTENEGLSLVFCQTKREVDNVFKKLFTAGISVGAIHGDFSQAKRNDVMKRFRAGSLDVLVATDVASRGIDIKDITSVINYCVPRDPKRYIHRIGRTGRIGNDGIAITLISNEDSKYLKPIERLARIKINIKTLPGAEAVV